MHLCLPNILTLLDVIDLRLRDFDYLQCLIDFTCLVAAVIISCLGSSLPLLREIDGELDAFLRYEVQTVESQTV